MLHRAAALTAILLIVSPAVPARSALMGVDEVKPGMLGTGITVFEGARRDEFRARILGVLENVTAPRRRLVLARLEGGPLASTGVIAGMSGSPVYVDGRLIGAVAYSLGAFSREPIAGITPIAEMIEAAASAGARPANRWADPRGAFAPDPVAAELLRAARAAGGFADRPGDVRDVAGLGLEALGVRLRPIATPLALSGFSEDAARVLTRAFGEPRFVPAASGIAAASAPGTAAEAPLEPGDAVGVSLVSGDLVLAATGTVTLVDGLRVYAFGHPFFNLGPTAFPMTRAYVHTVIPSLFSSIKIASLGAVVGAVEQDRATTIAGTLGPPPRTIPVRLALESGRAPARTFTLEVVEDEALTPIFTFAAILSVLQSYERELGAASFTLTGEARVRGLGTVSLDNVHAGDGASGAAGASVAGTLAALVRNTFAPVRIDEITLRIRSSEQPLTARIERAWLDAVEIRPGQTVPLKVLTRTWRGEEAVRTVPLAIPAHARGTLSVVVADAARTAEWDQREGRGPDPQSLGQLLHTYGPMAPRRARHIAEHRLADIEARLTDLKAMRRMLARLIRACAAGRDTVCPIVQSLSTGQET